MACPPKPVWADIAPSLFQHSPFTLAERWLLNWTVCCCSWYRCYTQAAGREHPVGAVRSPRATVVRGWDGVPFENHCTGFHTQAERLCLGFTNSSLEAQFRWMTVRNAARGLTLRCQSQRWGWLYYDLDLWKQVSISGRVQRACFKVSGALLLRSCLSAGEKGMPGKRRWAGYALCGEPWSYTFRFTGPQSFVCLPTAPFACLVMELHPTLRKREAVIDSHMLLPGGAAVFQSFVNCSNRSQPFPLFSLLRPTHFPLKNPSVFIGSAWERR